MVIHGKPGRLVELRKNDIMVPEYQREVDQNRYKRYAREFDWFLFGVLYVSYRQPDYYIVDGRHRLEATRLIHDIDMVPCMTFDFDGPQHEAEVFVKLQLFRKPLITKDMHDAELFAAGKFGELARQAQEFIDSVDCESVPLATIRRLIKSKPDAFARVAPMIGPLVGNASLAKDFMEALVYLEDMGPPGESLVNHQHAIFDMGYERIVLAMTAHLAAHHEDTRLGKIASPRLKAQALRWVLFEDGYTLEPQGELGVRVTPAMAD